MNRQKTLDGTSMFNPQHCGIYFTHEHIQQAREGSEREPYRGAWSFLRQHKPLDLLHLTQLNALRYRFDNDLEAGQKTVNFLMGDRFVSPDPADSLKTAANTAAVIQCFEMVRDHPAFPLEDQGAWLDSLRSRLENGGQPGHRLALAEQLWWNLFRLTASIALENEAVFQEAVAFYCETIRHDVHPEGYISRAVEGYPGRSLLYMLLAAQALVLTAEAAAQAGENLWDYHYRGVSAMTPLPYLLYYYYYPEKWRWEPLERETAQPLYRRHAGLWEIAQRRSPSRDRRLLLDELRPIYDVWSGGLTTLSHGGTAETKRRKLFGS